MVGSRFFYVVVSVVAVMLLCLVYAAVRPARVLAFFNASERLISEENVRQLRALAIFGVVAGLLFIYFLARRSPPLR